MEWLLTQTGELVAVEVADELRRLHRAAVELTALNRARIAESRTMVQRARTRVKAMRVWQERTTSKTVH